MIELSAERMEEILEGDEYELMQDVELVDNSRWSISYTAVVKKLYDSSFWRINWSRGATEMQDNGPENIYMLEVVPKEKIVTVYEKL